MGASLIDLLRARSPHSLSLSDLPHDFLSNRVASAQEIQREIEAGSMEATCGAPDRRPPVTLPDWEKALEQAAHGVRFPGETTLQLVVHVRRKSKASASEDSYVYPSEVRQLGEAYQQLCHIERLLRDHVHHVLAQTDAGYDSKAQFIPAKVRQGVLEIMETERRVLGEQLSDRLLDYVDFGFVIELVAKNWSQVEGGFAMARPDWEQTKGDLIQLRNAVMHSRRLKRHQRDSVSAVYAKILRAFGISPYHVKF
jgi:hypothetical protein